MKHILNSLLKGKQKRIMLVVELFFSFIAFFIVLSFVFSGIRNTKYPLGFEYKNIYKIEWRLFENTDVAHKDILNAIKSFPGIIALGNFNGSLFNSSSYMNPIEPLEYKEITIPNKQITIIPANDKLAEVLNLKVTEGRWFSLSDNASRYRPVVITQNLKERLFGKSNALENIIRIGEHDCIITGVCKDIKRKGDYSLPEQTIFIRNEYFKEILYENYLSISCVGCYSNYLIKCDAKLQPDFIPGLIRKISTDYPGCYPKITSLSKIRNTNIRSAWGPLIAILLVISALFLNVLFGLFGVLWYNISQRKQEIGLRMAVGANKGRIYWQFIEEMLLLATVGIVPGIIIAIQFPILKLFRIEVGAYVLSIIISAMLIYILVAFCALLPSSRATKIQPAIALHEE